MTRDGSFRGRFRDGHLKVALKRSNFIRKCNNKTQPPVHKHWMELVVSNKKYLSNRETLRIAYQRLDAHLTRTSRQIGASPGNANAVSGNIPSPLLCPPSFYSRRREFATVHPHFSLIRQDERTQVGKMAAVLA
ncbi:hypothetical protein QE152_g568 [Popillia japonica]|uniref:Uncharacterized protein n=1 Tax=Popillia japonica TaxID=7064 RepID=A0AAW1NLP6_POPJA